MFGEAAGSVYEGLEAPYVLLSSHVLIGVLNLAVRSECSTLIDWWRGASIALQHFEPVAPYTALLKALCGLLSWRNCQDPKSQMAR